MTKKENSRKGLCVCIVAILAISGLTLSFANSFDNTGRTQENIPIVFGEPSDSYTLSEPVDALVDISKTDKDDLLPSTLPAEEASNARIGSESQTSKGSVPERPQQVDPNRNIEVTEPFLHAYAPMSLPPVADPNGPYFTNEGEQIILDGTGSYDPNGAVVRYDWDLDGDGTFETLDAGPAPTYTWGDDYMGNVGLRVQDNEGLWSSPAYTAVTVNNVAPSASVDHIYTYVDFKTELFNDEVEYNWPCNITIEIYEEDKLIDEKDLIPLYATTDSPKQTSEFATWVDLQRNHSLRIIFNRSLDKPTTDIPVVVKVREPFWVTTNPILILTIDRTIIDLTYYIEIHKDFPIQIYELDNASEYFSIIGKPLRLEASASDQGSDDLTVAWDFSNTSQPYVTMFIIYYNNGLSPDPYQSPWGTYPFSVTDRTCAVVPDTAENVPDQPGYYTITLTIIDDDGGITIIFHSEKIR